MRPSHALPACARRAALALALAAGAILAGPSPAGAAPNSAFAGNYDASTISQYTIGSNDTLSPHGSPIPTGNENWYLEITPDAKYLYATNFNGATISQYSIGSDGLLTALSPATVAAGNQPIGLAISPDGHNAYVANFGGGSVMVFNIASNGTLTLAQTYTTNLSEPSAVAVSPDGASVYVGDDGNVEELNRASNGLLTAKSTASISAPTQGYATVVISPDGRSVYTAGTGASTIGEFNVGSGGELTPKTVASVPDGAETYDVTISPNGRNAYAPDCEGNNVRQYSIGAGGELAPLTPATVAAGRCPEFLWMTADGASAYAPSFSDADVNQYNVSTTGALTPKSPATAPAGAGAGDVVIPPDQGPVAAFTDPTARVGQTVQFDGSGSSDSDGTVARYDWSFGDGTTDPDGGPKVSHVYTKAGTYSVTLTVTDDSGCSTALVFTGQTAYCNASPGATLTRTVTIAAVKPKPSKLTARPRHAQAGKRTCFRFTFSSRGHGVRGATVRFAGHTAHTSRRGAARICLALHRGTYTARASKHGYRSARATVRITAAPRKAPAFTG